MASGINSILKHDTAAPFCNLIGRDNLYERMHGLPKETKEARELFKTLQIVKGRGSLASVEEFIRAREAKLKNRDVMIASLEHEVTRIGERIARIERSLSEEILSRSRWLEDPRTSPTSGDGEALRLSSRA